MIKGGDAQRAFNRSKRNLREQMSTKDFERLEQMTSLDRFVEEGQRIGNKLKTKGTSSAVSEVGNLALNIEPYARIVEGLCKLAPIGGDLLWGVVSFLLVISGTNANILEEVLSFFTGIAEEVSHLKLVEDTFIGLEMVVTAVEAVYVAIIEFWVKAVEYYMEKMKTGVRSRVKMWLISSTTLSREFAKLKDKISAQKTNLHEIEASQNYAIEKAERDHRQQKEILEYISAPEFDNHLHAAEKYRHDGTCEWVRHKKEYRDWTGCLTSGLLVVYGTAGVGKTILSSWLINQAQSRPAQHITLYHFFKGTDEKSNTALSATRSFLHQVYSILLLTNDPLVETLESRVRNLSLRPSIRFEPLWDILSPFLFEYSQRSKQEATPTVTLILDAMDECKDSKDLVERLRKLVHNTSNKVHVVVTGRPSEEHTDTFLFDDPEQAAPRILHITENDVQDDIAAFIKHSINHIERLGNPKHYSLRDRTIDILSNIKNHEGMFLWADLMCKEVKKQQRVAGIETLLKQLPKGLYGMYERICERLSTSDEIDLEFSRRVLEWVVVSKRPMTFVELEEALKFTTSGDIDLADKFFDRDGGLIWSRRDIVKCCGDLVRYSGLDEGDTISIVHLSAQQFLCARTHNPSSDTMTVLKPFLIDIPSAQLRISLTCIKYLLFTTNEYPSAPYNAIIYILIRRPLFDYATIYWADYVIDATQSGHTIDATQLHLFLTAVIEFTRSPVSEMWLEGLISMTYFEFAQHVIRRLRRLDVIFPPDILKWLDLIYKVLVDYSGVLTFNPRLVQLCISQPQLLPSDSLTTILLPAELRYWIHYDPNNDSIISLTHSAFKCQSLKTGIRLRPISIPNNSLPNRKYTIFHSAAASLSANHVAAGYDVLSDDGPDSVLGYLVICWSINDSSTISTIEDWATLVFNEFTPTNECIYCTNPPVQWIEDNIMLTPRGAFDLQTNSYVDVPRVIHELNSEHKFRYLFSGDSKRVAYIKHSTLEVLSIEGVSVYQVEFLEASNLELRGISHSGGKIIVADVASQLLCCIVVDEARRIDMPFAYLYPSSSGVFTRDERQVVASGFRGLTVWTFQQDLDGSYRNQADRTCSFVSQASHSFDLVPGAAVIVGYNGKIIRQPLDPEQLADETIDFTGNSRTFLKYNGLVPELNICWIKNSLITIEQWSLDLPHAKLVSHTESPLPDNGYHSFCAYSPHGTYLATNRFIIDTRISSTEFGVCELNLPVDAVIEFCEFNVDETLFAYSYRNNANRWTVCVLDVSQGPEVTQRAELALDCQSSSKIAFSKHNLVLLAVDKYLLRLDNHCLAVETQIEEVIDGFSECGSYYYDVDGNFYELPTGLTSMVQPPMDIRYLQSRGYFSSIYYHLSNRWPQPADYAYPPHRFRLIASRGIISLIHWLENVMRSHPVYVVPDGTLDKIRGCYLIWPEVDMENMKLVLVLDEGPILIDTRIRRGNLMDEDNWVLVGRVRLDKRGKVRLNKRGRVAKMNG